MFGLIFMWTPPHFWALALFMRSDYDDAGVPMLTVTHGRRPPARISWLHRPAGPVALGLGFTAVGGPVYLAAAVVLNALFLKGAPSTSGAGTRRWPRPTITRSRNRSSNSRCYYLFAAFRRALR
jgi:protoheme IX farnesyltransferase